MNKLFTLILLSLAAAAFAAEPKITETPEGITVEYTGTPADTSSTVEKQPAGSNVPAMTRKEQLTTQIDQLNKEIAEISKRNENASGDELAKGKALLAEKNRQIELYQNEIRITDEREQQKSIYRTQSKDDPALKQQNLRQEMKKEIFEGQKLRRKMIETGPQ